jgi:hypothetical protein
VQECPQPPPGPTSHAGRARTGAPTDRSRSLAIGRAVRGSRPDQCVDHRPCLPVFFSWLHFRQPRRQQPHVAAHSSDHRIGSGLRPPDRRPFAGARHPLQPHFARSSSAGHGWPAARDTNSLTLITSSGRHIMRRSVRQAPSAASTRPPRRTAGLCGPLETSASHIAGSQHTDPHTPPRWPTATPIRRLPPPCWTTLGEADQDRSCLDTRTAGRPPTGPITSETVIEGDMPLSWNVSLVPRPRFTIHRTQENTSLTCRSTEPPIGIEPMTYALRVRRSNRLS